MKRRMWCLNSCTLGIDEGQEAIPLERKIYRENLQDSLQSTFFELNESQIACVAPYILYIGTIVIGISVGWNDWFVLAAFSCSWQQASDVVLIDPRCQQRHPDSCTVNPVLNRGYSGHAEPSWLWWTNTGKCSLSDPDARCTADQTATTGASIRCHFGHWS